MNRRCLIEFGLVLTLLVVPYTLAQSGLTRTVIQHGAETIPGGTSIAAISPDGTLIGLLHQEHVSTVLQVWSVPERLVVLHTSMRGSPEQISFDADGDTIFALTSLELARVLDAGISRYPRYSLRSQDGRVIDGVVWHTVATRAPVEAFVVERNDHYELHMMSPAGRRAIPLESRPERIAIDAEGERVAVAIEMELTLYPVRAGGTPQRIDTALEFSSLPMAEPKSQLGLAFSPDGRQLLIGRGKYVLEHWLWIQDIVIRCIDVESGQQQWQCRVGPTLKDILEFQVKNGSLPNNVLGAPNLDEVIHRLEQNSLFPIYPGSVALGITPTRRTAWFDADTLLLESGFGAPLAIDLATGDMSTPGFISPGRVLDRSERLDSFLVESEPATSDLAKRLKLVRSGRVGEGIELKGHTRNVRSLSADPNQGKLYIRTAWESVEIDFQRAVIGRASAPSTGLQPKVAWVHDRRWLLEAGNWLEPESDEFDAAWTWGQHPELQMPWGPIETLYPNIVRGITLSDYLSVRPDDEDPYEWERAFRASGGPMRLISPANESGHDALVFHSLDEIIVFDLLRRRPSCIIPWRSDPGASEKWPAVAIVREDRLFVLSFGGILSELSLKDEQIIRHRDIKDDLELLSSADATFLDRDGSSLCSALPPPPELRGAVADGNMTYAPEFRPLSLEWVEPTNELVVLLGTSVHALKWDEGSHELRVLVDSSEDTLAYLRLSPSGDLLAACSPDNAWFFSTQNGVLQRAHPTEQPALVGDQLTWLRDDRFVTVRGSRCYVSALSADGRLGLLAEIVVGMDGDAAVLNRRGAYWTNPVLPNFIRAARGLTSIPAERASREFNRPTEVLGAIGLTDPLVLEQLAAATETRDRRSRLEDASEPVQLATLLPLWTSARQVVVPIDTANLRAGQQLSVRVNGVQRVTHSVDLNDVRSAEIRLDVPLWPAENLLSIVASDDSTTSVAREVVVTCLAPSTSGKTFFVGIAFNDYETMRNLSMAEADASRLAAAFEYTAAGEFVELQLRHDDFLPTGPTSEDVLHRVRQFAEHATSDDRVVVFFSGHGAQHDGGQVLCLPGTHSDDLLGTGLTLRALESALADTPAQTRLVLVDSCALESGEDGTVESSSEVIAADVLAIGKHVKPIVSTRPGSRTVDSVFASYDAPVGNTTLLAASSGELAFESPSLGGFFTHVVSSALMTGSADLNRDGVIHARELVEHAASETLARSRGLQRPTIRLAPAVSDLALAGAGRLVDAAPVAAILPVVANDSVAVLANSDGGLVVARRDDNGKGVSVKKVDHSDLEPEGFFHQSSGLSEERATCLLVGFSGHVFVLDTISGDMHAIADVRVNVESGFRVALSQDGSSGAVIAGAQLTIVEIDARRGYTVKTPSASTGVGFSRDGRLVVAAGVATGRAWQVVLPAMHRSGDMEPNWLGPATSAAVHPSLGYTAIRRDTEGITLTALDTDGRVVQGATIDIAGHVLWRYAGALLPLASEDPAADARLTLVSHDGLGYVLPETTVSDYSLMSDRLLLLQPSAGNTPDQLWLTNRRDPSLWWSLRAESIVGVGDHLIVTLESGLGIGDGVLRWRELPRSAVTRSSSPGP